MKPSQHEDLHLLASELLVSRVFQVLNIQLSVALLSTRTLRVRGITHYLSFGCSP